MRLCFRRAPLLALLLTVAGCAETGTALPPTPVIPTLAPTSTPQVAFVIAVTPVRPTAPAATSTPRPTPFVAPKGPYLRLSPSSGPPASRTILVRAGHLPPAAAVALGWSLDGRHAPITTTVYASRNGSLSAPFAVPASPPGKYHVVALVNGVRYAIATYSVVSAATMTVQVSSVGSGESLWIRGQHFLPYVKLLLIAYPMDVRGKPIVVATVWTGASGGFKTTQLMHNLALGQYALRAWSQNAMVVPVGEAFFQVVI